VVKTVDLVERSGALKAELLEFSARHRYDQARRYVLAAHGIHGVVKDECKAINALDHLLLQHRLDNGQTIVEQFVAARPTLPAPEREMLLGWRDVVEGIFEITCHDDDALVVRSLLDELDYRVFCNMGPDMFRPLRAGSFLIARLVPVGDGWLLSGGLRRVRRAARDAAYRAAADLAQARPELVFRNPYYLERGWELQREDRDRFVRFFGTDMVRVPGTQLPERMREYHVFSRHEVLARLAARHETTHSTPWPLPEMDFPEQLVQSGTVALIYDETEGLEILAGFGDFERAFTDPDALGQDRYRRRVLDYLDDDSVSPLPFRRMAELDPIRAGEVLRQVLGCRRFDWQRQGERLMRERKASFFERARLPRVLPVGNRLAPYIAGAA
jgi:hypothetical protein